jgi:tetratricopeptide (TPR) repeat protein
MSLFVLRSFVYSELLLRMHDISKALSLYESALKTLTIEKGPNHPEVAVVLSDMGCALWKQGKVDEGQRLLEKALNTKEKTLGKHHSGLCAILSNLALVHETQHRHQQALDLLLRKAAIEKQVHLQTGWKREMVDTLCGIGHLYKQLQTIPNHRLEANKYYLQAIKAAESLQLTFSGKSRSKVSSNSATQMHAGADASSGSSTHLKQVDDSNNMHVQSSFANRKDEDAGRNLLVMQDPSAPSISDYMIEIATAIAENCRAIQPPMCQMALEYYQVALNLHVAASGAIRSEKASYDIALLQCAVAMTHAEKLEYDIAVEKMQKALAAFSQSNIGSSSKNMYNKTQIGAYWLRLGIWTSSCIEPPNDKLALHAFAQAYTILSLVVKEEESVSVSTKSTSMCSSTSKVMTPAAAALDDTMTWVCDMIGVEKSDITADFDVIKALSEAHVEVGAESY